jgi:hypothetical protein
VLNDLIKRAKVPCGLTGIADLRTNQRDDRMESFVLSETLKVRPTRAGTSSASIHLLTVSAPSIFICYSTKKMRCTPMTRTGSSRPRATS